MSGGGSAPTLEPQVQAQQRRLSPAARASSARTASSKWGDSPGGRPGGGAPAGGASEEAGDVQPIAIYSERDLAREMAALAEHLNADGHRDEWTCPNPNPNPNPNPDPNPSPSPNPNQA